MDPMYYSLQGIDIPSVKAFHSHFLQRGGWFNYAMLSGSGLDAMYAASYRECRRRIDEYPTERKPRAPINFNFINNPLLNAVASRNNSEYFIGIYSGTLILLNELFLRIMSSRSLATHIGDSSIECNTEKIFTAQHWDLERYFYSKPDNEQLMPKDPKRQRFSIFYTKTALRFLLDHELSHIIFGHVDLASSKGLNSISEKGETVFNGLDSQTLEMDADASATHHAMLQLHLCNCYQSELSAEERAFSCNMKTGIENWMFAVYSFYRIFAYQNSTRELIERSHPPIGLRLRMIFGALCESIRKLEPSISESELIELHFHTLTRVEEAFTEISEKVYGIEEIVQSFSDESLDHIDAIINNWQKMRDKLRPYASASLAD